MKTKFIFTAAILSCMAFTTKAQEKTEVSKGKAIVQVFGNFHTGFGDGRDNRGFELERSYLGYEHSFGKSLSVKGVMDIGATTADNERVAYIKNAQVSYKTGRLTLNGGLISTTQFNMQEKFWGYRYVMKSFQDLYKFGSSADLGLSLSYKFTDWISADAIIVNGEGYKMEQRNDGLLYGLGATITPLKGFTVRLYGGINEGVEEGEENTINCAAFVGYRNDAFSLAAEYNFMQNAKYVDGHDQYGVSAYGTLKLTKNADLYARYDCLWSKDDWNEAKDESAAIIGAQFKLGKYVKIAPNFRMTMPKAEGVDNGYSAYINCYFGF